MVTTLRDKHVCTCFVFPLMSLRLLYTLLCFSFSSSLTCLERVLSSYPPQAFAAFFSNGDYSRLCLSQHTRVTKMLSHFAGHHHNGYDFSTCEQWERADADDLPHPRPSSRNRQWPDFDMATDIPVRRPAYTAPFGDADGITESCNSTVLLLV
jgi:hypothetical protein